MKLPTNQYITITQHHASQFQNVQNNDFIHKKLHVVQNVGKEVSNNVTIVSCNYLLKSHAVAAHCAGRCFFYLIFETKTFAKKYLVLDV